MILMQSNSPYFVLKTQFITKNNTNKSFGDYIDYINREEAKEQENINSFDSIDGYVDYMKRQQAKQNNQKISSKELKELEQNANLNLKQRLNRMKEEPINNYIDLTTGTFNNKNSDLSKNDILYYKNQFNKLYDKGNVMYQDVLSFDTKGLIEAGIYNPYNGKLNRDVLIKASRNMINRMIKDEKLDNNLLWIGQIHYNTKHFHIHFASIEKESSRKIIKNKNVDEQKGRRKQSTLDHMKNTFVNSIFDRSKELEQISNLRNELRKDVKTQLNNKIKYNLYMKYQFNQLKSSLPKNKNEWYMKNLSPKSKKKMEKFIDDLMGNVPKFKEYISKVKEENDFKEKLYGSLNNETNSYLYNRLYGKDGIYYRLGNSILEDMRKLSSNKLKDKQNNNIKNYNNLKGSVNKLTNILMNDYIEADKFKAKREYEQMFREANNVYDLDL